MLKEPTAFTFPCSIKGRRNAITFEETGIRAAITATCTAFFYVMALLSSHLWSVAWFHHPKIHTSTWMRDYLQISNSDHCIEIKAQCCCITPPGFSRSIWSSGYCLFAVISVPQSGQISSSLPNLPVGKLTTASGSPVPPNDQHSWDRLWIHHNPDQDKVLSNFLV